MKINLRWKFLLIKLAVEVYLLFQDEENITIPLHAYPIMSGNEALPESVILPLTPLGETSQYRIPLNCTAPIDFEFQVRIPTPHEAFSITPREGMLNQLIF